MTGHVGLLGPLIGPPDRPDRPTGAERRVLVVNSNSSARTTSVIATHLGGHLRPGSRAWFATAAAGPEGINSALDIAVGAVETARLVARYRDSFDAFVVACGNDPGLAPCRQLTDRPVVGTAEAGMLQSCLLGSSFAIPVFSPAKIALMRALVAGYGLSARLADVFTVDSDPGRALNHPDEVLSALIAGGRRARDRHLAESIVLTGVVMCPHRDALQEAIGIPVVDGLVAAVTAAESLVDQGARTCRRFTYSSPPTGALRGYDDLRELYPTVDDRLTQEVLR